MFHHRDTSRALVIIAATLVGGAPAYAVDEPTLSATVVDGSHAYTPTQLFAAYRDQLGCPVTRTNAEEIVDHIEALYARDGYSKPELQIAEDFATTGILRIQVFEAQITRVEFSGDAGPYAARLEELAGDLSLRVPLRTRDLQAALQSMRELPGLTVQASVRRDESRRNAYALTLATDYKPFDMTVELSNRGTSEIGPMFVFNEVVANSLLGYQERLGLFVSTATDTDEYRGGGVFVETPIGTLDPTSAAQLSWSAAFDWDDLSVDGQSPSEQVRALQLGGRIVGDLGAASRYLLGLQVRRGFDDYLIAKLRFNELVHFAQRWSMQLDAFGQHSADVLPEVERYKLGSERLGRGFKVMGIAGDQGLGARAELRRELSVAAAPRGKTLLYGFYDFAAAWKQDRPGRESAASAGLGLAVEFWRLAGYVEVAQPLTRADAEGDREAKVFAEVRLKL